jgi:hypothetical protein
MLVDYPSVKKQISEKLLKIFNQSAEVELGPFQGIGRTRQHEGRRGSYSTVNGVVKEQNYQEMGVNYSILYKDIPFMGMGDVVALVKQKGKEMGEKMGKYFFKTVDETIQETGNIVEAHGRPFSLDLMFETLEKMAIDFDLDGTPRMPTLIVHPKVMEQVRELIKVEETEKKYEQRHKDLIEKKRQEWYEKQNRRKLVD